MPRDMQKSYSTIKIFCHFWYRLLFSYEYYTVIKEKVKKEFVNRYVRKKVSKNEKESESENVTIGLQNKTN